MAFVNQISANVSDEAMNILKMFPDKDALVDQPIRLYYTNVKIERPKSLLKIIEEVDQYCLKYRISKAEICSISRESGIVKQRDFLIKHLRDRGYSLNLIGASINRTHATIIHSLTKKNKLNGKEQSN